MLCYVLEFGLETRSAGTRWLPVPALRKTDAALGISKPGANARRLISQIVHLGTEMLDLPPELQHLLEKRLMEDRRAAERRLYDLGPASSDELAEKERRSAERRDEERRDK